MQVQQPNQPLQTDRRYAPAAERQTRWADRLFVAAALLFL